MREIQLTQGYVTQVDDKNYEYLNQWKWYADIKGNTVYAVRKTESGYIAMHRLIMNATKEQIVDHINQYGLDNQECNLRFATKSDNAKNCRSHKDSTSKFKGVSATNKSYSRISKKTGEITRYVYPDWYVAQIVHNGKHYNLGTHKTEIEAAIAYDKKAVELFGEFASLNFPVNNRIRDNFPSPI
jgi:hypothetical protein